MPIVQIYDLPSTPRPSASDIDKVYEDLATFLFESGRAIKGRRVIAREVLSRRLNSAGHTFAAIDWAIYFAYEEEWLQLAPLEEKQQESRGRSAVEAKPSDVEVPAIAATESFWNAWKSGTLQLEHEPTSQAKVVLGLHGIRTDAAWLHKLGEVVGEDDWKCRTDRWKFGRFSVLRFLLPWQRETKIRWFRREYDNECNDRTAGIEFNNARYPSIVAHSFGTYILGNALLKYENIRFNKVILCGSILPVDFPWDKLLQRGQVQAVRNEYGTRDIWAKLVNNGVAGSGPSGHTGFSCEHSRLIQEPFHFDHSEYFEKGHIRANWLSFLQSPMPFNKVAKAPISSPDWPTPLLYWLLYLVVAMVIVTIGIFMWPMQATPISKHLGNASTAHDSQDVTLNLPDFMIKFEPPGYRDTPLPIGEPLKLVLQGVPARKSVKVDWWHPKLGRRRRISRDHVEYIGDAEGVETITATVTDGESQRRVSVEITNRELFGGSNDAVP